MPVDALLIPRLREEVLYDLEDDYVSLGAMRFFARELIEEDNHQMIRELVIETLVDMLDHPVAKVVDGPMRYTFSDPDELRHHIESMWPRVNRNPLPGGIIFWVVDRDDDKFGNSAEAPDPTHEPA